MTTPTDKPRQRVSPGSPMAERILFHTDRSGDCWMWTAAIDKHSGYGRIQVNKTCGYAHRLSYETFVGPIPVGMEIDHLCRTRACCNPSHLEAVTPRTNVLRGESTGARARRRTLCCHGMHAYATFGYFDTAGRRQCRECRRIYITLWRKVPYAERMRRKHSGILVVDLAEHFAAERVA